MKLSEASRSHIYPTLLLLFSQEDSGIFYPSHVGEAAVLLGWNVVGLAAIIAWTGATSFIMFSILAKFQMLRVEHEHEFKGTRKN